MAKHILHNDHEDYNFLLYGISCSANQYLLTNRINDALTIDLCLDSYVDLSHRIGKDFKFSLYTFFDEEFNLEYNLIPNRSNFTTTTQELSNEGDLFAQFNEKIDESSRLIPELTKTDFLLLVKGDEHYHHSYKIMDALKQIQEIITVQEIVPEELSNKSNLIF